MSGAPPRPVPRPSIPLAAWCTLGLTAGVRAAEEMTWRWHGPAAEGIVVGACVAVLVAAAFAGVRARPARVRSAALVVAGMAAGALIGSLYWAHVDGMQREFAGRGSGRWTATVVADAQTGQFGASSLVRVAAGSGTVELQATWPSSVDPPPLGGVAEVWGTVTVPENPVVARELRRAGCAGRLAVRRVGVARWAPNLFGVSGRLRAAARERIDSVPGAGGALLLSTVTGDVSRLAGTPFQADLQTAGLSHFARSSGYHGVVVVALLGAVLALVVRRRRWRMVLVVVLAGAFVMLSGARMPVVRAWSAAVPAALAWDAGRRQDGLAALSGVAAAFVCIAPQSVFDVGFALSLLGVGGILLFCRLAEAWTRAALPSRISGICAPVAVTMCAVCATLPLTSAVFGEVSLMAPVANLLAAPLVALALVLGLAGVVSSYVSVLVGSFLLHVAGAFGEALASVAGTLARVPYAAVATPQSSYGVFAVWASFVALLWVVWPQPTRRSARWGLTCIAAGVLLFAAGIPSNTQARVVVMDVGQGDAILLADGGHNLLIDTGPGTTPLLAALGRQGVRTLDGVVLTHFHVDHVGGLAALHGITQVPVVCVPLGGRAAQSKVLDDARLVSNGADVHELVAGDRLHAGSIGVDVVAPLTAVGDPATNEASVIVVARRDGESVLLTGDAESGVLDRVAQAGLLGHVDVLKVGHHGSAISLDRDLLSLLSPRFAVISVGAGNRYRHPRPEPLALLAERGIEPHRTDLEGDVTIVFGAGGCRVSGSHPARSQDAATTTRPEAFRTVARACATLGTGHPLAPVGCLEPDVGFTRRPQAGLPHPRNRGPPPVASVGSPQTARRECRRSRFQLREF